MHQYVIKCQPTERPEAFYYAGLVDEKLVLLILEQMQ